MAYVITDHCAVNCQMECLSVCPVDVIHGAVSQRELESIAPPERAVRFPGLQLYIDPDDCIDCGACQSECPVSAIYEDTDVPAWDADAAERNAAFYRARRGV